MHNKIHRVLFLILIATTVFLTACAAGSGSGMDRAEENRSQEEQITKEFIIEHSELTEEDLEDIDIQHFVEYAGITEEDIDEQSVEKWLEVYRKRFDLTEEMKNYNMAKQLISQSDRSLTEDDISEITKIVCVITVGLPDIIYFDFEEDLAYNNVGVFYNQEMEEKNETAFSISEEKERLIREEIRKSGIVNLPDDYRQGIDMPQGADAEGGPYYWALSFQLSDDTVITYSREDIKTPEVVNDYAIFLRDILKESPEVSAVEE